MRYSLGGAIAATLLILPAGIASAAGLRGSPASMVHQHAVAVEEDYSFLRTPDQVRQLVGDGALVAVTDEADFRVSGVSFPYARPEVRSFIEHLAARSVAETGERLVVTSLTRPEALQPANAHALSVHPAGMAVDFRVPASATQRAWLERTLLSMESDGLLDVTREHSPPHYHVAVFPEAYRAYAAHLDSAAAARVASLAMAPVARATIGAALPPGPPADDSAGGLLALVAAAGVLGVVTSRWLTSETQPARQR